MKRPVLISLHTDLNEKSIITSGGMRGNAIALEADESI